MGSSSFGMRNARAPNARALRKTPLARVPDAGSPGHTKSPTADAVPRKRFWRRHTGLGGITLLVVGLGVRLFWWFGPHDLLTSAVTDAVLPAGLMRPGDIPASSREGIARAADLVQRFPRDPRAHFLRAQSFLREGDRSAAEREYREGLSEKDMLGHLASANERDARTMLSTILLIQGRRDESKAVGPSVCDSASDDPSLLQERAVLQQQHLC